MKLKPTVFINGKYQYNSSNTTQQILLLNALKITKNPEKLRDLIHVKTVADVYRTLDKMSMRKEYHSALAKAGITFDYVVRGIKNEVDTAEKSKDRLVGLNMLLKSIGLDKYEETIPSGVGWEEALLQLNEAAKTGGKSPEVKTYDVVEPEMPENIRKAKEKANKEAKGLYD